MSIFPTVDICDHMDFDMDEHRLDAMRILHVCC